MSMTPYIYKGYGVDLGNLPLKSGSNDDLLLSSAIYHIDLEIDDEEFKDVKLAVPVNTDSFSLLMYIPMVYAVADGESKPDKIYTKDEADKLLAKRTIKLFKKVAKLDNADEFSMPIQKLTKWVKDNADYDYDNWSDFI